MTAPHLVSEAPTQIAAVGLFPGLLGEGGIQEAGRHTAAALDLIARRSHCRTCFLSLNDSKGLHSIATDGSEITFRGFGRDKLRFAVAAIRIVRQGSARAAGRPPLLLAAHPNLALPAAVARFFAPRCALAVQSHGIEVWRPLPFLRRRAIASATLVLAPSHHTAQQLSSVQRIIESRIAVLPWPLSWEFFRFAASPDELPLPAGFPTGRVILTVGRLDSSERYKGTDALLVALSQLRPSFRDLHLGVVGRGSDLPRLRQLAANLGVSECVHFFGGLSREALAACYARSEIFALPSTGEGFGLVFLEAMAFAKPLVAVAAGGSPDLVQDGINGLLVPPQDPEKLSASLSRLLSDGELRFELGRRGAERVLHSHRFEDFVTDLDQIMSARLK
jgi:phosphatidylinositol alpha-1,6-mannosyltransferase